MTETQTTSFGRTLSAKGSSSVKTVDGTKASKGSENWHSPLATTGDYCLAVAKHSLRDASTELQRKTRQRKKSTNIQLPSTRQVGKTIDTA